MRAAWVPTIADKIRVIRQESTRQESDILALADFLIINVVAGAPDGHSKIISILRLAGNTWVAPLYDLATGLVYDSRDVDRSVAVSAGGQLPAFVRGSGTRPQSLWAYPLTC